MLPLAHCVGRGLDSQAPSTSNKTIHLHNHHTIAGGIEDLLHRSVTQQGARSGGASNKEPGDMQLLQPRVK